MKFSVIVPVYNVEKYIKKCLESVLNQDFDDYEIVVVDDETPDNSMQIVGQLAQNHPEKFNIIHQENKGLGGARNTGIAAAKGEYLIFIDSDDYIEKDMLSKIDARLSEIPCDMVMFNFSEVTEAGNLIGKQTFFREDEICQTAEEKSKLLLAPPCAWNKVFRREFFIESGVLFPEKTLYEDVVTRILTAKANKIFLCDEHFYNYVQRQGSIMKSKVSPRVLDIIKVTDLVCDTFEKEGLMAEYKDVIEAAQTHSLFTIAENVYNQSPSDPMQKDITGYITEKFPNYLNNLYLPKNIKKEIYCLVNTKYIKYKYYKMIDKMKVAIYNNFFFTTLNKIRKKIVG
ncbi:MAG: glycosyltransferase family 2 protein [Clostridia bacterium]|nr:glycosyltransferase family 2 protein [Clostridia bacterium]